MYYVMESSAGLGIIFPKVMLSFGFHRMEWVDLHGVLTFSQSVQVLLNGIFFFQVCWLHHTAWCCQQTAEGAVDSTVHVTNKGV